MDERDEIRASKRSSCIIEMTYLQALVSNYQRWLYELKVVFQIVSRYSSYGEFILIDDLHPYFGKNSMRYQNSCQSVSFRIHTIVKRWEQFYEYQVASCLFYNSDLLHLVTQYLKPI